MSRSLPPGWVYDPPTPANPYHSATKPSREGERTLHEVTIFDYCYPRRRARWPLTDRGLLGLAVLLTSAAGLALAHMVLP
jgi:hypothetical protein